MFGGGECSRSVALAVAYAAALQVYCPKVEEDYPIFFATSERSGKDNSGEYLCKIGEDSKAMLNDHGHLVIDHSLTDKTLEDLSPNPSPTRKGELDKFPVPSPARRGLGRGFQRFEQTICQSTRIDHDLDEIADTFVDFAKQQKFSFWREG